jgi:hypothetical protein
MTLRQRIAVYWFAAQWYVRDVVAAILQDLARAIAPGAK